MTRQSGLEDLLMIKFFLPLIVGAAVALTACSSANYNKDEVPNIAPDAMYSVAQNAMASGDFQRAKQYLEAIDAVGTLKVEYHPVVRAHVAPLVACAVRTLHTVDNL